MRNTSFVYVVVIVVMVPLTMASVCHRPNETMDVIRRVHVNIRGAFVAADEFIASRFDAAGDACISQVESQGLTGRAAIDASNECMQVWLQLDQAFALSRESLAELENVYNNIEAGNLNSDDWMYWGRQVLAHGRAILRIISELELGGAEEIINGLREAVDQICELVSCEGGV